MMFTSIFTTVLLAATAAQCAPLASSPPTLAPLYKRSNTNSTRYIVAIHPNTVQPANRLTWLNGLLPPSASAKVSAQSVDSNDDTGVVHNWDPSVFNGLAGNFDDASLAILRAQSQVAYIEEDVVMRKSVSAPSTQTNAPWGLSRLSSATKLNVPTNFNPTNVTFPYTFPSSAGSGVDIYIVDSGIHTTHSDFGGRATFLENFSRGINGDDKDGHGTHVAGTSAGTNFGVAKKANIFAVKVLDDSGAGPISDIISGLNLVGNRAANQANTPIVKTPTASTSTTRTSTTSTSTTRASISSTSTTTTPSSTAVRSSPLFATARRSLMERVVANVNNFTLLNPNAGQNRTAPINTGADSTTGGRRSVVNMSLGGTGHSPSLDAAVQSLVQKGVVVVIAAGNDGVEVADASPADVKEAITVGAMDVTDAVPSFSNFGAKVDVFAPGLLVLSLGVKSNTDTAVLSGTSMAAPHVAGLSALLLGEDPTLTPAQVKTKIQSLAIRGALGKGFTVGTGTKNLIAQNGL